MASAIVTVSNYWKYKLLNTQAAKAFTLILMQPGFVFDKDAHLDYADISASECATAYGYTATTGIVLAGTTVAQDNTNDRGTITFSAASITPTGGNITIGGILLLQTTDDIIVQYGNTGTVTLTDGATFSVSTIGVYQT